jgi:hypothetical protein
LSAAQPPLPEVFLHLPRVQPYGLPPFLRDYGAILWKIVGWWTKMYYDEEKFVILLV